MSKLEIYSRTKTFKKNVSPSQKNTRTKISFKNVSRVDFRKKLDRISFENIVWKHDYQVGNEN